MSSRTLPPLDAGLNFPLPRAVEHYEMARYGTLKRWAEELGMKDAAKLLNRDARGRKRRRISI